jgi:DNA repair protein RecN (Recombination protein N)
LCITHLPQVAARGARHLHVSKSEVDGRTLSVIHCLSSDERVAEIARMLGGVKVSEAAREAARALLAG